MNFENIMIYVCMGLIIACLYYVFKIVGIVIFSMINTFHSLSRPEPNRKRQFKNVNEIFILHKAANEFGFTIDKTKPIEKNDLKNRFRNKAKKAHPDCGGNMEEFIRIKKAYDILSHHITI